jgi:hypothetical protein
MDYKPELVYQSKLDAYGLDKPKLQEQELGRWILCRGSQGFYHNNVLKGEILDIYSIYYYRNLFMLT